MDEGLLDDRYTAETLRLVRVLDSVARSKNVSIRSLEKKMGVGDSVFSKVLKGKITLQVRHVLMICDALEIPWDEFFTKAYAHTLEDAPGDPWEGKVIDLLVRLGVIPEGKAGGAAASSTEQ